LAGGVIGALAANLISSSALQWTYVGYLVLLNGMMIFGGKQSRAELEGGNALHDVQWLALLIVGVFAGLSSGFLGIGGGLATVVGLSAVLKVPQHQAQMISLVLSLIPTTIPSAWVYWSKGALASWPTLVGVMLGLIIGTELGARVANRIDRSSLRITLIVFVSLMALYMAFKALS
jgi:uncharacterized protein